MFVVNTPGTWEHAYPPLLHAEWNGWTYTDTIFPFFLFIIGVAMAFSFSRRAAEAGDRRVLFLHTLRRAAIIFFLGLGLNTLSFFLFHRTQVRIPGVLQRIGVCYLLAATLSAIATTLFGIAAGELLRSRLTWPQKLAGLMAGGAVGLSLGHIWGLWFPINKNLWTSSYSLFMAGLAAVCLALCIWIVDVKGWKAWSKPFVWLGRNAIALFVLSTLATLLLLWIKLEGADGKRRSLYGTIYRTVFDHFADPRMGSLLFALTYCAALAGVAALLYRKKIFIKV